MNDVRAVAYVRKQQNMDLKLYEECREIYDLYSILVHYAEIKQGFRIARKYKPNSIGTRFKCVACKDENEVKQAFDKIIKLLIDHKMKYNVKSELTIETIKKLILK